MGEDGVLLNSYSKKLFKEQQMEPEKIMIGLSDEVLKSIKSMEKAKTPEEKLTHSKTIKNLCESLGVFLNLMSDMDPYGDEDDYDDGTIPFPF